jgi:hypothetical protein
MVTAATLLMTSNTSMNTKSHRMEPFVWLSKLCLMARRTISSSSAVEIPVAHNISCSSSAVILNPFYIHVEYQRSNRFSSAIDL